MYTISYKTKPPYSKWYFSIKRKTVINQGTNKTLHYERLIQTTLCYISEAVYKYVDNLLQELYDKH